MQWNILHVATKPLIDYKTIDSFPNLALIKQNPGTIGVVSRSSPLKRNLSTNHVLVDGKIIHDMETRPIPITQPLKINNTSVI